MPTTTTAQTLSDLASCGCKVKSLEQLATEYGLTPAVRASCPDADSLLRLLVTQVRRASQDPEIFDLARRMRRSYPKDGQCARALHAWMRFAVKFLREPGEIFQRGRYTAKRGTGDCDCQTILLGGLGKAAGIRTRVMPFVKSKGDPRHVCAQFFHDGKWNYAETTIAARYGEHPIAAAKRLGIGSRPDILGGAS